MFKTHPYEVYIIVGTTYSYVQEPYTNTNIWLIRTDKYGDTLWTKNYGGAENESSGTIKTHPDGGFVLMGNIIAFQTTISFLLKMDSLGNGPFPTLTAVNDLPQDETAINIYPNPSIDEITVEFEVDNATETPLTIYDATGKILRQFTERTILFRNSNWREDIINEIFKNMMPRKTVY